MLLATVSPLAYWTSVFLAALGCLVLCVEGRKHPGKWRVTVARVIGSILALDAVSYTIGLIVQRTWSPKTSLPLALCDMGVFVAALACWWRSQILVEVTYFWGLAGTLQGVLTPDLNVSFPHLVFFQYVLGHLGIVAAALFLVVGMTLTPRRGAVLRVFLITVSYTAFVGAVDWLSGADYMFLRKPPGQWTLLRLLGPWPWYIPSAAVLAIVLFSALDAPFYRSSRRLTSGPQSTDIEEMPEGEEANRDTSR